MPLIDHCYSHGSIARSCCSLSPALLRGLKPGAVTAGQTTYDLRRLKARGLIARIPHSHRYTVTDHGLPTARFLTCVHDRPYPTDWPSSPTPPPHPYALPLSPTTTLSKTSAAQ